MLRKLVSSTLVVALAVVLGATNAYAGKPATNQTPEVTAFDVAAESASPVPVSTFTATDADGNETIAGYLITETPTKPSAGIDGWSAAPPTQYTTTSLGGVTLYAWAKDNKNAVSDSRSDTVTIIQPSIDADTLDGKHASEFAAAAHDHDAVYQRKYGNVVVVAKSGGDFTDPITAINSITNASATNPYLLKIMPGIYDLGSSTLFMKEYVVIEGSGEDATVITSAKGNSGTVSGANNSELRFLSVENVATTTSIAIRNSMVSPRLTHVTAIASGGSFSCLQLRRFPHYEQCHSLGLRGDHQYGALLYRLIRCCNQRHRHRLGGNGHQFFRHRHL